MFLSHRIWHEPAGKGGAVLPRAEVGIADAEVRSLVLLAVNPSRRETVEPVEARLRYDEALDVDFVPNGAKSLTE